MRLFVLLFALGLSLLAPSEAAPDWQRVVPSRGHVKFAAVERDETGTQVVHQHTVESAPKMFTLEFGMQVGGRSGETNGPQTLVSTDFSILSEAPLASLRGYGLLVDSGGSYTELIRTLPDTGAHEDTVWKDGGEAKALVKSVYELDVPLVRNHLCKFEAVQRLLSPKGLMRQVMMAVFDPEGYKHYKTATEHIHGHELIKRVYEIDVPNDSAKHYDNAHMAKLYTTWESVLGMKSHSANTARHLADFRTPVKSARIVTYENTTGQLWLHSIALYRDKTPEDSKRLSAPIIEFISDEVHM